MNRWLGTRKGQRYVMAWCMAVQLGNLWFQDLASWGWWTALGCLAVLVVMQSWLEWSRRPAADWRWALACEESDPIGAMARMEYLDTLTRRQVRELIAYLREGAAAGRTVDLDDVPQVVKGYVLAGVPPEYRP